jgi:hypothetical protein
MAEDLFENAITVSPSGIRSSYLLHSVRLLRTVLKEDEDIFANPHKPFAGKPRAGREVAINTQWQIGYRRSDLSEDVLNDMAEKLMMAKLRIHDDAISLQSYRPTIYFCHAVSLLEFLPVRTVATIKKIHLSIRTAIEIAQNAKKDDVCIYSFTGTYGEMITADEFIRHMENCLRLIGEIEEGKVGKQKQKVSAVSDQNIFPSLMTLNF